MGASNGRLGRLAVHSVDEKQVLGYLLDHPEFLKGHPELLITMAPSPRFSGKNVVDLQHVMITRLNSELRNIQECAKDLIISSHGNMSAQSRIHGAVLAVLGGADLAGLNNVITTMLPKLLGISVAVLAMEPGARVQPSFLPVLRKGQVLSTIGSQDAVLRQASVFPTRIFGKESGLAKSYALVKLEPGNGIPCGLLALGASNEETFHAEDNTDLISFLGSIIEDCLIRWWPSA